MNMRAGWQGCDGGAVGSGAGRRRMCGQGWAECRNRLYEAARYAVEWAVKVCEAGEAM